ncbi:MAG: helix-turn-helix domain-containing protein [Firmicutes bacterium]|nr:helix-turn-helix domain-containing protein [Bacillota bacterium]
MNIENEIELLTIEEMEKILKISRSKAYMLIKQKDFPVVKIGKCVRVSKKDLLKWLRNVKNMI